MSNELGRLVRGVDTFVSPPSSDAPEERDAVDAEACKAGGSCRRASNRCARVSTGSSKRIVAGSS